MRFDVTDVKGAVHTMDTDKFESKFLNIDCMEVLKKMPDKCVDLCIVDPPYRDKNAPTRDMRSRGSMESLEGRPTRVFWHIVHPARHGRNWRIGGGSVAWRVNIRPGIRRARVYVRDVGKAEKIINRNAKVVRELNNGFYGDTAFHALPTYTLSV